MSGAAFALAAALALAPRPDVRDLPARLAALVAQAEDKGAVIGVHVVRQRNGETLFAHHAGRPQILASNTKVLTSAAALQALGQDYRFRTEFLIRGEIVDGNLDGDLVVIGRGDPGWRWPDADRDPGERFEGLASSLASLGIARISGQLVLDGRALDDEGVAPGWPGDQLHLAYCAPVSAFPLNDGVVRVIATPRRSGEPASLRVIPRHSGYALAGTVVTSARGKRPQWRLDLRGDRIHVSGSVPEGGGEQTGERSASDPPAMFGSVLRGRLSDAGITIIGETRRARARDASMDGRLCFTHETPIGPVIREILTHSNNLMAELALRTLPVEQGRRGTRAAGIAELLETLRGLGVDDHGVAVEDGSGLSRGNRCSPRTMTALLAAMWDSDLRNVFLESLPVAGRSGTLESRMTDPGTAGLVRAKTGWIAGVSALSGYVRALDGELLVFSILVHDPSRKVPNRTWKEIQDRICSELAAWDGR